MTKQIRFMSMEALFAILIVALVLLVVWYVVSKFLPGNISSIVGIILGLILLIYAMQRLGLFNTVRL